MAALKSLEPGAPFRAVPDPLADVYDLTADPKVSEVLGLSRSVPATLNVGKEPSFIRSRPVITIRATGGGKRTVLDLELHREDLDRYDLKRSIPWRFEDRLARLELERMVADMAAFGAGLFADGEEPPHITARTDLVGIVEEEADRLRIELGRNAVVVEAPVDLPAAVDSEDFRTLVRELMEALLRHGGDGARVEARVVESGTTALLRLVLVHPTRSPLAPVVPMVAASAARRLDFTVEGLQDAGGSRFAVWMSRT